PDGFAPGAPGLDGLARPLAAALAPYRRDPGLWLARLRQMLDILGASEGPEGGWEPDGLAAEVVAATNRLPDAAELCWRLRQFLLHHADAWRTLAVDARRDLLAADPRGGVAALKDWDHRLDKGTRTARFYELMLNACDGPTLAAALSDAVILGNVKTIGSMPWWASSRSPDAWNDLREGFARMAPLAPLPAEVLPLLRAWMPRLSSSASPPASADREGGELGRPRTLAGPLSPLGEARWRCLAALSAFHRPGLDAAARRQIARDWAESGLPLDRLGADDRYRFLAWLIHGWDEADPIESEEIARLARWLLQVGITDVARLRAWRQELADWVDVPDTVRLVLVNELGQMLADLWRAAREGRARR
ncbi:MAG: hypothetical protein IRY99_19855, partial [Isosphaeraceae bacterium]|nr:hypothetical protein [Isosphaeraceae bacterium]